MLCKSLRKWFSCQKMATGAETQWQTWVAGDLVPGGQAGSAAVMPEHF